MEIMNQAVLTGQIKKKKRNQAKLVALLLVLVVIGAAFFFSAQPASISKLQSASILEIFKGMGFENITMHFVRKLAHFVLFGVIGGAFTFMLSFKFSGIKLFNYAFFSATFMAILDETHQMFVPGRGPQVKDVLIDAAGAFTVVLLLTLLITHIRKSKAA